MSKDLIGPLEIKDLPKRGLSEETCKFWGYGYGTDAYGRRVQVATYYDKSGKAVAQKYRTADKKFGWVGDPDSITLYGQHLWRDKGKYLVITEGEIDAMSVSQAQGNKWPVVSVPSGAQSAASAIAKNLEWVEQFDNVVLMFDMDEPGQTAAREVAELLSPGKAKIARLPLKDANEMLVAGKVKEIIDAVFGAKSHRPDGIVAGTELWESISQTEEVPAIDYPWGGLSTLTRGCRIGEIVTIGAGSGTGKSQFTDEIAYHFATKHNETVGIIALEEGVKKTGLKLMSLHANKRLHLSREGVTDEEFREAYDATLGSGKFFLYDHFGSMESENVLAKIRYMVRGLGCSTVILDHISIVVSGREDDDERKAIDKLMTDLRVLVEQLKFRLILVSHLKRPPGDKGHEDGVEVHLSHFRGSHAIGQLSDIVIGLERSRQDPKAKNFTLIRVVKNRWSGEEGEACWVQWNDQTGRLTESTGPDEVAAFSAADSEQKDF